MEFWYNQSTRIKRYDRRKVPETFAFRDTYNGNVCRITVGLKRCILSWQWTTFVKIMSYTCTSINLSCQIVPTCFSGQCTIVRCSRNRRVFLHSINVENWILIHEGRVSYPPPTLPSWICPLRLYLSRQGIVGYPLLNRYPRVRYPALNHDFSLRIPGPLSWRQGRRRV